jgi:hypothetical protein
MIDLASALGGPQGLAVCILMALSVAIAYLWRCGGRSRGVACVLGTRTAFAGPRRAPLRACISRDWAGTMDARPQAAQV